MKVPPQQAENFVQNLPAPIRAVLLFGPDQGMVRERADTLIKNCAGDRHDPFRVVDLTADELRADPARLSDESAAFSMTGGRRAIHIEGAADNLTGIIRDVLSTPTCDALLVLQAGELRAQSSLRRLFEKEGNAAAIACYPDSEAALARLIEDQLGIHSIAINADVVAFLTNHLGNDRQLVKAEVQKLALYAGEDGQLTKSDIRACIGGSADFALDDIIYAAADGDQNGVELALQQGWQAGAAPVGVVRALQRHVQRLATVAARIAAGTDSRQAMRTLRPPVFWKQERRFLAQARSWSPRLLAEALTRLVDAEVELKLGRAPERDACARTIMSLTQIAARNRHG